MPKYGGIKGLMIKHFMEAYNKASDNGTYATTARQVFYGCREIINIRYKKDVKKTSYNPTFTQKVLTKFYDKYPELEEKIYLDRRGFFTDPYENKELPIGTGDVIEFINEDREVPIELLYNHVLFVEKEGFNTILKQSGLSKDLNLGIMSTKGNGSRAGKNLMKYLLDRGVKVYVLHDCDYFGYNINDNIEYGGPTFEEGLNVEDIGLNVEDVKRLGKDAHPEIAEHAYEYTFNIKNITQEEIDFFKRGTKWVDEKGKKVKKYLYARVELNSFTTKELLDFLRSKITYMPIKPEVDQLIDYIPDADLENDIIDTAWDYIRDRVNVIEEGEKVKLESEIEEIKAEIQDRIDVVQAKINEIDERRGEEKDRIYSIFKSEHLDNIKNDYTLDKEEVAEDTRLGIDKNNWWQDVLRKVIDKARSVLWDEVVSEIEDKINDIY